MNELNIGDCIYNEFYGDFGVVVSKESTANNLFLYQIEWCNPIITRTWHGSNVTKLFREDFNQMFGVNHES